MGEKEKRELPKMLAASSPHGLVSRTMMKKRRKEISVRPAMMHSRSSGKRGKKKVKAKKVSRFRSSNSKYLGESLGRITRSAKSLHKVRAKVKVVQEPTSTATKVMRNPGQTPKAAPPAAAMILLGMGAMMTLHSWSPRKISWDQGVWEAK